MKLRKPCVHDRYEGHTQWIDYPKTIEVCPGGVFLPDDTLVIEKVDGEWPEWALFALGWIPEENRAKRAYTRILDALSVREAV